MHTAKYAALALAVVAMLAVSAALTVLLLDANALRAPISGYMSRMLDRAFAINGDLRIALSDGPRLEMNKVVLGNAAWGSRPAMLTVERVVVAIDLTSLLKGRLVLPVVALSRPDVLLEQNLDGKANWTFGAAHASTPSAHPVEVGSLWIEGGEARFRDPAAQTDVTVKVDSERSAHDSQVTLHFTGQGSFRNEPFRLQGRAVAPLERRQAGTHYRLEVQASAGDTKTAFTGTLVPLAFETIDGELTLSGPDLATLYPLVPVPLPWTPAYRVSGHFVRDRETYALHGLHGQIGNSDIEGTVALDISRARPRFNGDLVSRRLDYQDLLGFLGVPPPSRGQPRPAAQEPARRS